MNTQSVSRRVYEEQILLLYTKSPVRPILHILPGVIIYWLVADFTEPRYAKTWLAILIVINILRFLHINTVRRSITSTSNFRQLAMLFASGCGLVGFCYGIGLAWFLPYLPELQQLAILTVAVTVIPGAMVSFSTSKPSFMAYLFPKLGIPMILCLGWDDSFHSYIFYYGIIYLVVILTLFNWYYSALTETIRTRLQNNDLVESLRKSNRQLAELSTIDGLTGVSNRRHFDELLEKEMLRSKREGKPISLLMLDIDYFKEYNDEYGHLSGDECLRTISKMLQEKAKRAGDIVARYGGEEFCIIVPNTDIDGACRLAREIHVGVEQLRIYHGKSGLASHITVSIGVASVVPDGNYDVHQLLNSADAALYEAKNRGRNRIEIADLRSGFKNNKILTA